MSVQERLQMKREPLDKWSIREQLCLASAVTRSGDQNWMSVSRAVKQLGEPSRPMDWFHQKYCAAQYGALLASVDTPKRKKRNSGETVFETPAECIVSKLLTERKMELKKSLAEEKAEYRQLQENMKLLQSGNVTEEQLDKWCKEIDEEECKRQYEAIAHAQWLNQRDMRKMEIEKAFRPAKFSCNFPTQKTKYPDNLDEFVDVESDDSIQQYAQPRQQSLQPPLLKQQSHSQHICHTSLQETPPKPALSPLLTSLLKSPSQVPNVPAITSSILHDTTTDHNQKPFESSSSTNPTIASLLNMSTTVAVSQGLQQLVSTAIGQKTDVSSENRNQPLNTDIFDEKIDDLANSMIVQDGPLPEIKKEEVDDIISEIIENAQDIVTDPEQHLEIDGNGNININMDDLEENNSSTKHQSKNMTNNENATIEKCTIISHTSTSSSVAKSASSVIAIAATTTGIIFHSPISAPIFTATLSSTASLATHTCITTLTDTSTPPKALTPVIDPFEFQEDPESSQTTLTHTLRQDGHHIPLYHPKSSKVDNSIRKRIDLQLADDTQKDHDNTHHSTSQAKYLFKGDKILKKPNDRLDLVSRLSERLQKSQESLQVNHSKTFFHSKSDSSLKKTIDNVDAAPKDNLQYVSLHQSKSYRIEGCRKSTETSDSIASDASIPQSDSHNSSMTSKSSLENLKKIEKSDIVPRESSKSPSYSSLKQPKIALNVDSVIKKPLEKSDQASKDRHQYLSLHQSKCHIDTGSKKFPDKLKVTCNDTTPLYQPKSFFKPDHSHKKSLIVSKDQYVLSHQSKSIAIEPQKKIGDKTDNSQDNSSCDQFKSHSTGTSIRISTDTTEVTSTEKSSCIPIKTYGTDNLLKTPTERLEAVLKETSPYVQFKSVSTEALVKKTFEKMDIVAKPITFKTYGSDNSARKTTDKTDGVSKDIPSYNQFKSYITESPNKQPDKPIGIAKEISPYVSLLKLPSKPDNSSKKTSEKLDVKPRANSPHRTSHQSKLSLKTEHSSKNVIEKSETITKLSENRRNSQDKDRSQNVLSYQSKSAFQKLLGKTHGHKIEEISKITDVTKRETIAENKASKSILNSPDIVDLIAQKLENYKVPESSTEEKANILSKIEKQELKSMTKAESMDEIFTKLKESDGPSLEKENITKIEEKFKVSNITPKLSDFIPSDIPVEKKQLIAENKIDFSELFPKARDKSCKIHGTTIDTSKNNKREIEKEKNKKDFKIEVSSERSASPWADYDEMKFESKIITERSVSPSSEEDDKKNMPYLKSEKDGSVSPWREEDDKSSSMSKSQCSTPIVSLDNLPDSPLCDDDKEYRAWRKSVLLLYYRLSSHKYSSIFLKPITDEHAPGYSEIVRRPMDLSTIKKNIDNGMIRTTLEFKRDVMLMFCNAIMFNNTNDTIYNMTMEMMREAIKEITILLQAQVETDDKPGRRETRTGESGIKRKKKVAIEEVKAKKKKED